MIAFIRLSREGDQIRLAGATTLSKGEDKESGRACIDVPIGYLKIGCEHEPTKVALRLIIAASYLQRLHAAVP